MQTQQLADKGEHRTDTQAARVAAPTPGPATARHEARALYDAEQVRLARKALSTWLEGLGRLTAKKVAPFLDDLLMAVDADTHSEDFEAALQNLQLAYSVVNRLAAPQGSSYRWVLLFLHVRLLRYKGDLLGAVALCDRAFDTKTLLAGRHERSGLYATNVAYLLYALGQVRAAVALGQFCESQLLDISTQEGLECLIQLQVLKFNVSLASTDQNGVPVMPIGWDMLDKPDALALAGSAIHALQTHEDAGLALGLRGHLVGARRVELRWVQSQTLGLAERLQAEHARVAEFNRLGRLGLEWTSSMEVAGFQLRLEQFSAAHATLQRLRVQNPSKVTDTTWGEKWHWCLYLCAQALGRNDEAHAAMQVFCRLADERVRASRNVLVSAPLHADVPWVVRSRTPAADAVAHPWPMHAASLRQRIESCLDTATTVHELSAAMGVTPRRLQQMFKDSGLPSPARFFRQRQAG